MLLRKILNLKLFVPHARGQKGALLLELLVVIALLAVILSVGAQAVYVSLRSGKVSGERDVAVGLASETLEAVRSTAEEKWQNIYSLTKATQNYFPTQSSNKWILSSGVGTVVVNGITYSRSVVIDNVSRDQTTRFIESSYTSADDDPHTQKVTVTVSWPNADAVTLSDYFFRWRNKVCSQTGWSTAGSGSTVQSCPTTSYDTKDAAIDASSGTSLKVQ